MARFSIASVATSLADFRKLPQHVQARALLKALADRFPNNTFNRENLLIEPYNTVDPDGFSLGLPEEERRDAVKFLTLPSESVSHKWLSFVVVVAVEKLESVFCFPAFP
jgi:hypothetical protein